MTARWIVLIVLAVVWLVPTAVLGLAAWDQDTDVMPLRPLFIVWMAFSALFFGVYSLLARVL